MSEVKVDKISPKTGTSMTVGDSGDTFTVPSGATLTVAGALNVTGTTSLADGTVNVAELDIDGASDIGAGIADADLFVVDDNAAGANRKTAASRLKTYILADNSLDSDMYVDGSIDLAHMSVNSIDSDQYVDGSIDTAHLADNQVTLAKMAGLARGKIIYGDASGDPAALAVGSANQVLTHDGTDLSWAAAGGITHASQWRLATGFTGDAQPIASNIQVVDTDGYGSLGSDMTHSSGVFTFPATGFWFITFIADFALDNADTRYAQAIIETTTNNSSWDEAAKTNAFLQQTENANTLSSCTCNFLFDVTNTTNCKVRFTISVSNNSTNTQGNNGRNYTHMTFIRLGDT